MSGHYSDTDLRKCVQRTKPRYEAVCPVGETCDNWRSNSYRLPEMAAALLREHLLAEHSCGCEEGWIITNPDWPEGDLPYRHRCPEGCPVRP